MAKVYADPGYELQKAIFSAITSDTSLQGMGVNCYSRVRDTDFPYVVIGEDMAIPDESECVAMTEMMNTVRVYSREPGSVQAKQIAAKVRWLLDLEAGFQMTEASGFKVLSGHCVEYFQNDHTDGLTTHIEMTFRFQVVSI